MTLLKGDLNNMLSDVFEVDSFASKMGDDKDICTLSFSLRTKEAADDLSSFIEKGYASVLDSDATAGEQSDGTYKVFVEVQRDRDLHDNIMEILDGVTKLCSTKSLRFRYYKNFRSKDATIENITAIIPNEPDNYGINRDSVQMENYKNFFGNSFVESVDMLDDVISIKKAYTDPLFFKFFDFGTSEEIQTSINESFNTQDFAEIIFLTKYIGDYNISKYGDKLVFENQGKSLVLKRI